MTATALSDVQYQIQKFWAPMFTKQLRNSLLLGSLVNRDYQGTIAKGGDTVTVSQINAPTGQLLTVGTNADGYTPEALSTSYIQIQATKRAVASFQFEDLVGLQANLDQDNSEVRASLLYAMNKQIENYLLTLVNPSTSAPDHLISGVTDFNASQLSGARMRAAIALWDESKPWYVLADPSYYSDLLNAQTLVSSDYVGGDMATVGGKIGMKRFGFQIFEHNLLGTDTAIIFHPDFLHLVMQQEVQVKVSDLHPTGKFGYAISVDCVFGAALGINGNVKHQKVYNS